GGLASMDPAATSPHVSHAPDSSRPRGRRPGRPLPGDATGGGLMAQIREFEDADQEAVIALWDQCGLLRPWNDPRKDIARKRRVQGDLFLVAVVEESIVGVVMAGYEGHR